jgi:hypothetical protein
MVFYNEVRVAAGLDQTLSDSDNIEAFTPNTGNPQRFKAGRGGMVYFAVSQRVYSEGQARFDLNGAQSFSGKRTVNYTQPGCHPDAYEWLVANYRGLVTCNVPQDGTTYDEWNAWLHFEKSPSNDRPGWYSVRWVFTLIEAIP